MKNKQLPTWLMDEIEFGLSIWYFKKEWSNLFSNEDCTIPFHDFKRRYKEYCR